jgi:hypothetical protein
MFGAALAVLASGCASMRAVHLAQVKTAAPLPAAAAGPQAVRENFYDLARLRWDGRHIWAGDVALDLGALKTYLTHAGAPDLAAAVDGARPAYLSWADEEDWPERRRGSSINLGGGGGGSGGAEAVLVVYSAIVVGVAAYVATDELVRDIGSDLNPQPCREDVLEAFNQRLALALGLDPSNAALVTCMPSWNGLSGRDRGRATRLVRIGIASGLGAMVVAGCALGIAASNNMPTPTWAWPTGLTGLGVMASSLVFGYTVAW